MNKRLITLVTCGTIFSTILFNCRIAPAYAYTQSPGRIYLNGSLDYNLNDFAATDPASGQATTYFPIWYVMQLLDSLNIQNSWDGHNWVLTTPAGMNVGAMTTVPGTPDSNRRNVFLNNLTVESPYAIVTTDPSSGSQTTYFPIWYIMQILNALGVQNSWDGTAWTLSTQSQPSTSTTVSLSTIVITGATSGVGSSGSPAVLLNNAVVKLSTVLTDSNGNPLINTAITFNVSDYGNYPSTLPIVRDANGNYVSASRQSNTSQYTVNTDTNGIASITINAPGANETYEVVATAPYSNPNGMAVKSQPAYVQFIANNNGQSPTQSQPPTSPLTVTLSANTN